jgi:hypothetical protein
MPGHYRGYPQAGSYGINRGFVHCDCAVGKVWSSYISAGHLCKGAGDQRLLGAGDQGLLGLFFEVVQRIDISGNMSKCLMKHDETLVLKVFDEMAIPEEIPISQVFDKTLQVKCFMNCLPSLLKLL